MKIAFETQINRSEYFEYYSDEELRKYGIYDKEKSIEPINIKNFDLSINEVGNLVMYFDSENYKYLKFDFGKSSNYFNNQPTDFWAKHLTVESPYKLPWVDEDTGEKSFTFLVPLVEFEITLLPETELEDRLLGGQIVSYSRWSHSICFVPWEQIEQPEVKSLIDIPDFDKIYSWNEREY